MLKKSSKRRRSAKGYIVAIDGPAGAGKSTVSRQLAETLSGVLLDTGSMYRAVAYYVIEPAAQKAKDYEVVARKLHFSLDPKTQAILVNGHALGNKLRTTEVSEMASSVSRFKMVRKMLTAQQRKLAKALAKEVPVIVEGRDIGTVVFPDVDFKFFVTASPEVRAQRRFDQLRQQGVKGANFKQVLREQESRDHQDSTRKLAPLKCAEDAVIVDTSSMEIAQVVHFMRDHIVGKLSLG